MKKFRIVGLLLVLCLISSSFVGVTFAKYTSTASGSDNAFVAKWKIEVNDTDIAVESPSIAFDLFDTVYEANVVDAENNVSTSRTLIAPGTGGYFVFKIENLAEVDAKYTLNFAETNTAGVYVQYTLDKAGTWYDDFTAINTALTGVDIGKESGDDTVTIYWRWAFEKTTDAGHDGQSDLNDTALGRKAKDGDVEVAITATINVYQVD